MWVPPHGGPARQGVRMVCMSFFDDQTSTEPEPERARPHHPWDLPDKG